MGMEREEGAMWLPEGRRSEQCEGPEVGVGKQANLPGWECTPGQWGRSGQKGSRDQSSGSYPDSQED